MPLVILTEGSTLRTKMPLILRVISMSLTTAPNFKTLKEFYRKFPAYFSCPLAYHEATLTNRNTAPLILKLGARWKWSVSRPGPLLQGKQHKQTPLHMSLGGAQVRPGRFGDNKKTFPFRDSNQHSSLFPQ